ncbi:MAG: DUF4173 domain-containing protein [Verrucomicrobiota bacterium]
MDTTVDATTPPPPPPPLPKAPEPIDAPVWRIALLIAIFIPLADFLVIGSPAGLGCSLLIGLGWMGMLWSKGTSPRPGLLLLSLLMITTLGQSIIELRFSNVLVLLLLTAFASAALSREHREIPVWQKPWDGFFTLFRAPFPWALTLLHQGKDKAAAESQPLLTPLRRGVGITIPVIAIAIPFLIFLGQGNAIFGNSLSAGFTTLTDYLTTIDVPSFPRMLFWGMIAFLTVGLCWPVKASRWLTKLLGGKSYTLPTPKDSVTAIWRTRLLLLTMNLMFCVANTIDVFYLWFASELPKGVGFSEYVHQGTHNLIICVLLSALVITFFFQQKEGVKHAPGQRSLALLWMAQNLLLVGSVIMRLKMYVDAYQLSVLRVHLAAFLLLVCIGFLILGWYVARNRSFGWLCQANLAAVFLLFFTQQFVDIRGIVADHNVRASLHSGKRLDLAYLKRLGAPAWPALLKAAQSDAPFARLAEEEVRLLTSRLHRDAEELRLEGANWRSYQWRFERNRKLLLANGR